MADPNRLSEHSKRECEPSESGSSADEKWFCLHCDEIDKELNNNQPTEKEPVTKENIDTTKNQLTKKPAKEEIRETTEKEPSTKEYIDTTKNQPTEKEPVKKEITKTTEKEPVSKEKIQTTNKQSTNKELMMKEKTSYLNDIKVIKIDDPSNEPMPKTSKNNETKNRDPDDPHREDSLESNESFKRRFVRLPLNKGKLKTAVYLS